MSTSVAAAVQPREAEAAVEGTALIQAIERAATNPAVDVDKMERLLAMQERIMAKNAEMSFNAAMRAAQEEMPKILRNKENAQTNSRYADLERLNDAAIPVYTKHGFSLSFGQGECPTEGKIRVLCFCSHESGYTRNYHYDASLDLTGLKGNQNKTAIHGEGSTFSYARRYLTLLIFNISLTNEDNDGNNEGGYITESQVADLMALADEVKANREGFLKYMGVERLADIPVSKFKKAVAGLEAKRGR